VASEPIGRLSACLIWPGTGSAKTDHAHNTELNERLRAAFIVFADPRLHGNELYAHSRALAGAESHSGAPTRSRVPARVSAKGDQMREGAEKRSGMLGSTRRCDAGASLESISSNCAGLIVRLWMVS
jgi:hypothetical protein